MACLLRRRPRSEGKAVDYVSRHCLAPALIFMAALALSLPVRAGQWLITISGTPVPVTTPPQTPPTWNPPTNTPYATVNYGIGTGRGGGPGQVVSASDSLTCPLHIAVAWSPNGPLSSDPQPTVLRLTETGSATWSATGTINVNGTSVVVFI